MMNKTEVNSVFIGYRYDQERISGYEAGFSKNISQEDIIEALNAVAKKANQLYGTNLRIVDEKEANSLADELASKTNNVRLVISKKRRIK